LTSRREFLQAGLIAAALPVAARADVMMPATSPPAVALYKVLYDTRFPASVEFAGRAAAQGLAVHAMAGDMTRFWYDDLYHRWRQGPAAIAGLTAHGALFCLERLAWDQRMRVVYRGEHAVAASGCVAHRFEGASELASAAADAAAGPGWAGQLADVIAECRRGGSAAGMARASTVSAAASSSDALFSWVIAPVSRG
jgi:hypothetical protein